MSYLRLLFYFSLKKKKEFLLLFLLVLIPFMLLSSNKIDLLNNSGSLLDKTKPLPEDWIPYIPTPEQTQIEFWLSEGKIYAKVTFFFESANYRIWDWGTVNRNGNDFSVNTKVIKCIEFSPLILMSLSYTYELGTIAEGMYTFTLSSWYSLVEIDNFTSGFVYVPDDFPTIQSAMDAIFEGGEVIVREGTYIENIDFKGKNIYLHSTQPTNPDIVADTIIDSNNAGPSVTFSGTENENCILSGFTITKGTPGILGNGTHSTIQYNIIKSNSASYNGGGLDNCQGLIQYNTISGNSAISLGGGLYECNGLIQHNNIMNNTADMGGGLYACNGRIDCNVISKNTAQSGGGLSNCDGVIEYNTISKNTATGNSDNILNPQGGGGLYYCGATIQFNNIWLNSATGTNGCGGGLFSCSGTICDNQIWKNSAVEYGGGLHNCGGIIFKNDIWNNVAHSGSGLSTCSNWIINNTIWLNSAKGPGGLGGGIYNCLNLRNCMIYCNTSDGYGGGLSDCGSIQYNTVWGNSASSGGGGLNNCSGTISDCIIWQNSAPTGAQLNNCSTPINSFVTVDPLLLDPFNDNLHLSLFSPCIDYGQIITGVYNDFELDPRPFGPGYDIGADEYTDNPHSAHSEKPMNLLPMDGSTALTPPITLKCSYFTYANADDFHLASHWQIDIEPTFSSPQLVNFFEIEKRISITVPNDYFITSSNQFYWRVRHLHGDYIWGEWSKPTTFSTIPMGSLIPISKDAPTTKGH